VAAKYQPDLSKTPATSSPFSKATVFIAASLAGHQLTGP
jgi:hypothetical protein